MYERIYAWFIKALIFFTGARAFHLSGEPVTEEIDNVTFNLTNGMKITFHLYCEDKLDAVFRWGKLYEKKFRTYTVRANFDSQLPESLTRFNGLRVFIISEVLFHFNVHIVFKVLVDLFLKLIQEELEKLNKK